MSVASKPIKVLPFVQSSVSLFIGVNSGGKKALRMVDGQGVDVTDGFAVKKSHEVVFKGGRLFRLSDFKRDSGTVDAPWNMGFGSVCSEGGKDGKTAYCSEQSGIDNTVLEVQVNGDGYGGRYTFQVTMDGYSHDPEMDVEC